MRSDNLPDATVRRIIKSNPNNPTRVLAREVLRLRRAIRKARLLYNDAEMFKAMDVLDKALRPAKPRREA